jgi:threonyl-tRNA synthetase
MFPDMQIEENETFILRPMACPHHVAIYKSKPRSFRELPIRYAELVKQYRYEASGSLLGLERVRAMELTDSHIFLRSEQVKDELKKSYKLIKSTLDKFNIEIDYIELALYDPAKTDKYHGDSAL